MINLENLTGQKLKAIDVRQDRNIMALFVPNEQLIGAFKAVRDGVVFTNARLILVDVQGVSGKRKSYSSIPYKAIEIFAVETAGNFDHDVDLAIWLKNGMGFQFTFSDRVDILGICRVIGTFAMEK
jgi:hypothetical protein